MTSLTSRICFFYYVCLLVSRPKAAPKETVTLPCCPSQPNTLIIQTRRGGYGYHGYGYGFDHGYRSGHLYPYPCTWQVLRTRVKHYRCVVWALGEFFFFYIVFWILIIVLFYIQLVGYKIREQRVKWKAVTMGPR